MSDENITLQEDHDPSGCSSLFNILLVGAILLLVVAGYLSLPNINISPIRSKVAVAHSEMRMLAIGLESYYIDNNIYPPPMSADGAVLWATGPQSGFVSFCLTTPVVNISSLPDDPFNDATADPAKPGTWSYRYATYGITCWIMASNGPDQDADIDLKEYVDLVNGAKCDITKFLSHFGGKWVIYDPTNGTTSDGDIIRTGP